jgi:predicted branched-subunit amino acid permease
MKNIRQIIGLVLTISPVGVVVGVVGRLTGMNWLLADMMG